MKNIVKVLVLSVLLGSSGFCNETVKEQEYLVLYPLETTKQAMQVFNGSRFTELDGDKVKVAFGVLNNPLVNATYADVALFAYNGTDKPCSLLVTSVRTRAGALETLRPETLRDRILFNDIFMEKASMESLAPKVKAAHGCAPGKKKDSIKAEEMSTLQKSIADFQSTYRLKLSDYLSTNLYTGAPIQPGSIGGGIMRIMLPTVKDDGPMLLKLQAGNEKLVLRLQLQRLQ